MQLATIGEFVHACEDKCSNAIYELFEFNLTDQLRTELYELASEVDDCSPEPVRCVINHLGELFDVDSMRNY